MLPVQILFEKSCLVWHGIIYCNKKQKYLSFKYLSLCVSDKNKTKLFANKNISPINK